VRLAPIVVVRFKRTPAEALWCRPWVRSGAGPRLLQAGIKPEHSFLGDQSTLYPQPQGTSVCHGRAPQAV